MSLSRDWLTSYNPAGEDGVGNHPCYCFNVIGRYHSLFSGKQRKLIFGDTHHITRDPYLIDRRLRAQLAISGQFYILTQLCHEQKILFVGPKHFFRGRNNAIPMILAAFDDANPAVCFKSPQFSAKLRFAVGEGMVNILQARMVFACAAFKDLNSKVISYIAAIYGKIFIAPYAKMLQYLCIVHIIDRHFTNPDKFNSDHINIYDPGLRPSLIENGSITRVAYSFRLGTRDVVFCHKNVSRTPAAIQVIWFS